MTERLCPLCDHGWDTTICPVHAVPTLGPHGATPRRLEVGTVLVDRYRIDHLLGQGGMGAVFSATELSSGRRRVVKVLRSERLGDPGHVRRFYQEARAARALRHPNIVDVVAFGVDAAIGADSRGTGFVGGAPFLVMSFAPGRTLRVLIRDDGPLPEARAAAVFLLIARALAAAHRAQVLHRDLKPSNIMVDDADGACTVKVLDFGLAKILEDPATAPLTQPGKAVGTPAFMSPEQVTQQPQDFRTDLYGLGCVLHVALTATPPFAGSSPVEVMRNQLTQPPPPLPAELADGRPPSPGLIRLHGQLLAKAPDERPASTDAVAAAFERLLARAPDGRTRVGPEPVETRIDLPPSPHVEELVATVTTPMPDDETTVAQPVEERPTKRLDLDALPEPSLRTTDAVVPRPTTDPEILDSTPVVSTDDTETPILIVKGQPAAPAAPKMTAPRPSAPPAGLAVPPTNPIPRPVSPQPLAGSATRGPSAPTPTVRSADAVAPSPPVSAWGLAGVLAAGVTFVLAVAMTLTPARSKSVGRPPPARPVATPRPAPAWTSAFIEIRTRPAGAEVVADADWIGRTPLAMDRPAAGERKQLLIKRQGYRSQRVELRQDTDSPLEIELQPR